METGSGERERICRITEIERQKIEQAKDKIQVDARGDLARDFGQLC